MEADSIAAIATAPGEGGIGIVRVSGPVSLDLPVQLFPDLSPVWDSHHLRQGRLVDPRSGITIDSAAGIVMRGPHSYTGEDVFEIQCHGSPLVLAAILSACFVAGCRPANPGEFTLRAFLNGRLDLSQAEAVIDIVRARGSGGLDLAVQQLQGSLSQKIDPLRGELLGCLAHMEAMVDFVEDDIPPALDTQTRDRVAAIAGSIDRLADGISRAAVVREGASLAIVGAPNAGKSSMMNALVGRERSIVTAIAGTTRDTIEDTARLGEIPFRIIDTAGIAETVDLVEQLGIERSREALGAADLVLFVLDRSRPWSSADEMVARALESQSTGDQTESRVVMALNKADLPNQLDLDGLPRLFSPVAIAESSAILPGGADDVAAALALAATGSGDRRDWVAGNARHGEALRQAGGALEAALTGLETGTPLDLVSLDVRAAIRSLDSITGADVDEELLDRIFRDFCIGK